MSILKNENYRPANIEFNVATDGSPMPETFGEFETAEDAAKFIGGNLIIVNQGITVSRHMDFKEKTELRTEYNDVLENELPIYEKELSVATQNFTEAKKELAEATEMVSATTVKAKSLAAEVKRGLKEMSLDELFTYRIAYKGRYYFYTYIDKKIVLCRISDIPEFEKGELFNAMAENEHFIDANINPENPAKSIQALADKMKAKITASDNHGNSKTFAPKGKKK